MSTQCENLQIWFATKGSDKRPTCWYIYPLTPRRNSRPTNMINATLGYSKQLTRCKSQNKQKLAKEKMTLAHIYTSKGRGCACVTLWCQSASISINQHQPESISTNRHQSAPISINQHQPAVLIGCWFMLIGAERCQRVTQVTRPFSIYVKISQDWQKEKSSNHQKFLVILSPVLEKWSYWNTQF